MLPVDAQITASAPSASACVTATHIPRSLKLPVGFAPSHLTQSSIPSRAESRGTWRSGVEPSPSDTAGVPGASASRSR